MATFQLVHSNDMQCLMENPHDVDEAVLLHALIDVFACEMHPLHVVVTIMVENKNGIEKNQQQQQQQQILLFHIGTIERANRESEMKSIKS